MAVERQSIFLTREGTRRQETGPAPIPEGARIGNIVASSLLSAVDRDPETGRWPDDPAAQCASMFKAVEQFMAAAGGTPANIVQLTVYLRDELYRGYVNKEWLKMFPDPNSRPGRVIVYRDFPGHNLYFEVSLIAVL